MEKRVEFLLSFIDFAIPKSSSKCPNCNGEERIASQKFQDLEYDNKLEANIALFKSICANCEYTWIKKTIYYFL